MKYFFTIVLFVTMIIPGFLYAQKDTVDVQDFVSTGGTEGTLNDAVAQAITAGTLSNTVFRLSPYGLYVLSGTINTPAGSTIELYAEPAGKTQETAPPMIAWTASTAPSKTYSFNVSGNIKMTNIWILYAGVDGAQVGSAIRVGDSSGSGGSAEFDNCIFDYAPASGGASGCVDVYSTHFKGKFNNCYFKNDIDTHLRYYGRALSFNYASTNLHSDSVWFENCTFANLGYVYMQEGAEYGDNVFFNHCTFYNIVVYSLESPWWWKMYVTNSLFVNAYMYGSIPSQDSAGVYGGTIQIDSVSNFGFTVSFTDQERHILFANNSYDIQQWLVDWMGYGPNGNPYSKDKHKNRLDDDIPVPQPMLNARTLMMFDTTDGQGNKIFPYINKANLYDGLDPRFVNPPINLDSLKQFMYHKWFDNSNVNWAWEPDSDVAQVWPLKEDMSYANDTLKMAAMGGFPLGDLRWWPDQYTQWMAQKDAEHTRINTWLETGTDPGAVGVKEVKGSVPLEFKLSQNYPNPFNPETKIEYSVPKSAFVTLKVYNLLGQEVATLFSGNQKAGNYEATFNGANLASGVYMYSLQSDNVTITKKFVFMK